MIVMKQIELKRDKFLKIAERMACVAFNHREQVEIIAENDSLHLIDYDFDSEYVFREEPEFLWLMVIDLMKLSNIIRIKGL